MLIAEIGGNHEGNFEYAERLADLAISSGADYVKFQIYTGDGLVNPHESPERNAHFKKFELTSEQHISLAKRCKENGVGYLASVWDVESLEWIDPYMDFYKIGSGDMTDFRMLSEVCKKKKPILLSSGLATESEVLESVRFIRSQDDFYQNEDSIAILQCTSMYPIPDEDANLNVMKRLGAISEAPFGYSDHTEGMEALITATVMGASVLEFHFTDSREGKSFRDHKVSLTNQEVKELIDTIQSIKRLQGSSDKQPLAIEGDHITSFRRAVYPTRDISEGAVISEEDLTTLRPNVGISAVDYFKLIGGTVKMDLKKHQKLDWKFFEL